MWCPAVEGSTGRSLQELSEARHGDSRRVSEQDVDVVIGVSGSEKAGVSAACLAFEECGEPPVHARVQPVGALPCGPDEMDHEHAGGMTGAQGQGVEGTHKDLSAPSRDSCVAWK